MNGLLMLHEGKFLEEINLHATEMLQFGIWKKKINNCNWIVHGFTIFIWFLFHGDNSESED